MEDWLRRGYVSQAVLDLMAEQPAGQVGVKFNPNHDPANGRFTSGAGGASGGAAPFSAQPRPSVAASGYEGVLPSGKIGVLKPVSGGSYDRSGRYLPEVFPPDPQRISNPVLGLEHYIEASGKPRNFYINQIDLAPLQIDSFPRIHRILKSGKPGNYPVSGDIASFDTNKNKQPRQDATRNVIGGLHIIADGTLVLSADGRYSFDGSVSSEKDTYSMHKRGGRDRDADNVTTLGRAIGLTTGSANYDVYIIGRRPFQRKGRWR